MISGVTLTISVIFYQIKVPNLTELHQYLPHTNLKVSDRSWLGNTYSIIYNPFSNFGVNIYLFPPIYEEI